MTLVWFCLSLAASPSWARAPAALEASWAQEQPFRLRNEAVLRLEYGDFEGARDRLEFLEAHGELDAEPAYYLGLVAELQSDYEGALDHYTRVVDEWPDSAHASNARFRRALCLEDLGRHHESLEDVEALIAAG